MTEPIEGQDYTSARGNVWRWDAGNKWWKLGKARFWRYTAWNSKREITEDADSFPTFSAAEAFALGIEDEPEPVDRWSGLSDEPAPAPKPRTVTVRVPVVVGADGDVVIVARTVDVDPSELAWRTNEAAIHVPTRRVWITAEVPLPEPVEPQEIRGDVE